MAVERVERWLRQVTDALNAAGIPYALVGGNAVAAWVATVDPQATRSTKDVDLLVRRSDAAAITHLFEGLGFRCEDLRGWLFFLDPQFPSRRSGVHLIWAGQRVKSSDLLLTPDVDEFRLAPDGFRIIDLPALVRMKLTSFRDIDRAHLIDMISVGLIDAAVRAGIPDVVRARFDEVERRAREQEPPDAP
jgi:hypothetical protein